MQARHQVDDDVEHDSHDDDHDKKKFDKIEVVEIISGGPAWRQNLLEVGDIILKVRQNDEDESD